MFESYLHLSIKNLRTTHKFYYDLGPRRPPKKRDPIIGSMTRWGGGGSQLKVQGMNSYPVNKCIHIYIFMYRPFHKTSPRASAFVNWVR